MFSILFFDLSVQILAITLFSIIMIVLTYYALRKILMFISDIQSDEHEPIPINQTNTSIRPNTNTLANNNIHTKSFPIYPRFGFYCRRRRRIRRHGRRCRW